MICIVDKSLSVFVTLILFCDLDLILGFSVAYTLKKIFLFNITSDKLQKFSCLSKFTDIVQERSSKDATVRPRGTNFAPYAFDRAQWAIGAKMTSYRR